MKRQKVTLFGKVFPDFTSYYCSEADGELSLTDIFNEIWKVLRRFLAITTAYVFRNKLGHGSASSRDKIGSPA